MTIKLQIVAFLYDSIWETKESLTLAKSIPAAMLTLIIKPTWKKLQANKKPKAKIYISNWINHLTLLWVIAGESFNSIEKHLNIQTLLQSLVTGRSGGQQRVVFWRLGSWECSALINLHCGSREVRENSRWFCRRRQKAIRKDLLYIAPMTIRENRNKNIWPETEKNPKLQRWIS